MPWTVLFHDDFEVEFYGQRRFYKRLIHVADERYDEHVGSLAPQAKESQHGKKTR